MANPLLSPYELPPFGDINVEDIEAAIDEVLNENLKQIDALANEKPKTWEALMARNAS